jgi:hypothetical protein
MRMKKAKKTNSKSDLHIVGWFTALLTGILSFLFLFERKQIKGRDTEIKEKKEEGTETEPGAAVPDDESRIFNLRNFGWFAGFLVGMIAFVLISGALLSGFFLPGRSIIITQAPTLLPPAPRLQVDAVQDFQKFQATQQAELNSYGWIDRDKGVVHIPIERAMELIAQSNLPVATGTPVGVTPQAP